MKIVGTKWIFYTRTLQLQPGAQKKDNKTLVHSCITGGKQLLDQFCFAYRLNVTFWDYKVIFVLCTLFKSKTSRISKSKNTQLFSVPHDCLDVKAKMSDCPWRQHGFCGVSGKRLWRKRVHVSIHIHAQSTAGASLNWGSSRFALLVRISRCVGYIDFSFPPTTGYQRRTQNGPGPHRALWILRPALEPHLRPGRRLPHPASVLSLTAPSSLALSPGRNVKQPRRQSLQGRRLRPWLEKGLLEQHVPRGWTSAAAAPEPHTAGGCVCPSAASVARSAVERLSSARCCCYAPRLSAPRRRRAAALVW